MQRDLRILGLLTAARLRSTGWAPWLLLAAWLVAARVQEPRMLRSYGLYILDDAAWSGGLLVLLALLFAEPRLPRRAATASNLTLLVVFSLLLMCACLVLDQGPWSPGPLDRLLDAWMFCAAFAPLAVAASAPPLPGRSSRLLRRLIVLAFLLLGTMLGVGLRSGANASVWLGVLLGWVGATAWRFAPRTL